MKPSRLLCGCFVVLALVQLAVPATMILRHERTLQTGDVFKFRTRPVDPYDAFRGRYVQLQIEQNSLPLPVGTALKQGQKVFAVIGTASDGFAQLRELRIQEPDTEAYLVAHVSYVAGQTVYLKMPFDRYYMEESLAPAAERAYREHSSSAQSRTYISVRVRNGTSVIENLWIDGVPITEFLARK